MPDTNDTNTNITDNPVASAAMDNNTSFPAADDVTAPIIPDIPDPSQTASSVIVDALPADPDTPDDTNIMSKVASKIAEAHNILVALSSNPSVDEMATAIGLTIFLDRIGKHVTAIYSGNTPNALEFLKPDETFEQDADVLQDFVIALNKEKADHLRYKVDGDYVKIFITPYRSRIGSEDLEYSYGDFNVDLVLALDVANGVDLDDALREHGRIMHDATVINITTGKPGKLGEIEWSDQSASSIAEMVAELLYGMNEEALGKEESTAFLTGIIAATNRFANAVTTPRTMKISSRLMESGANQQLISKNITNDVENEFLNYSKSNTKKDDGDPTKLEIEHSEEEESEDDDIKEEKEITANVAEKDNTLLEDLKAAEASLAHAAAEVTEDEKEEPLHIDSDNSSELESPTTVTEEPTPVEPEAVSEEPVAPEVPEVIPAGTRIEDESAIAESAPEPDNFESQPETVVKAPTDLSPETLSEGTNKYGQMLENALDDNNTEPLATPTIVSPSVEDPTPAAPLNPAVSAVPTVPTNPEINGVPEINYMPLPGDEVLPPPPAPPINFDTTPPTEMSQPMADAPAPEPFTPATPVQDQPTPLGPQPAMQDQVYQPQAATPDAFKIPGM